MFAIKDRYKTPYYFDYNRLLPEIPVCLPDSEITKKFVTAIFALDTQMLPIFTMKQRSEMHNCIFEFV